MKPTTKLPRKPQVYVKTGAEERKKKLPPVKPDVDLDKHHFWGLKPADFWKEGT